MSEERRAAPRAGGPVAEDTAEPIAPHVPTPLPPARRRLSLRIPDDEVARPNGPRADPSIRPVPPVPRPMNVGPPSEAGPLTPMRIITISEPPPPPAPPVSGAGPVGEDDWSDAPTPPPTPNGLLAYEPERADSADDAVDLPLEEEPPSLPPPAVAEGGRDEAPTSDGALDAPELAAEDLVTEEPPPVASVSVQRPARLEVRPPVAAGPGVGRVPAASPRPPLVIVPPHVGSIPPVATEAQRRKGRLWWEDLFNDDYLRTPDKIGDEQIAREVGFIEDSLAVERGGALLDVACGTGRHAVELARRGYEVVGFDLSLAMLARAGEEAQDRDAKLNFIQGDMREMAFGEQFDGVYCWNTSFGYFEEDKNAQVIARICRALKVGGLFLLDVVNRDFLVRQSPSLAWFEGDGCVCMDEMCVDFITSRMKVKRTMMLDDGRSREIEYSMRVYSLHELGRILHEHGFKVCEVSGRPGTPGVFFGNESPRVIILAEKR